MLRHMAKDAFGNEQDDDALESMGWTQGGEVPGGTPAIQTPTPAPTSMTPSAPGPAIPSTWSPPSLRLPDISAPKRRGGGVAAAFGVVVLAAVVFAIIGIAGSNTSIHLPNIPKPDIGTTSASPP